MKHYIALGGMLAIASCSASQRKLEADVTYLGQNLECVDRYDSKAGIEECRRLVRERWGIVEAVMKDAGADR